MNEIKGSEIHEWLKIIENDLYLAMLNMQEVVNNALGEVTAGEIVLTLQVVDHVNTARARINQFIDSLKFRGIIPEAIE